MIRCDCKKSSLNHAKNIHTFGERDVDQHFSRGLLNKGLASVLGKSAPTVNQVRSILAKTGLPVLSKLTPAERLVAVHVAQGMNNKEIAALLGKAEPTVKHQVSSILRASNAQSRCQFIAFYYQQFFCPLPFCEPSVVRQFKGTIFAASYHGANCSK